VADSAGIAQRVLVGWIRRAVGLRGEVLVEPTGDDPDRFRPGLTCFLDDDPVQPVRVRTCRPARKGALAIALDGMNTREDAERLRGRSLWVGAEVLPPLPAGVYYHFQVIGLRVVDANGTELGRVETILQTGSNDVYCVRMGTEEILIPAIGEYVAGVDLTAGVIRLAVPRNRLGTDEPPI
jgi:16S rRNA processing protein RimM